MKLPNLVELPVNLLTACFNNTSATYKFYWLISILQEVEGGNMSISKRRLFARMVSNAWYTVNYFRVSFGKQDLIQKAVEIIREVEKISIDEKQDSVLRKLSFSERKETTRQLWHFNNNVPHWFMSPWFSSMTKNQIYKASKSFGNDCPYALYEEHVELNPIWKEYLVINAGILKDFCLWNLTLFLQAKNPNVPDIANKLVKPAVRNSLAGQRNKFWNLVISELGSVKCIYTGKDLSVGDYAVEHFIPYNFVSHDLMWNLIPSDRSFNSSKSDKLPPLEKYFVPFYDLQKSAVEIVTKVDPSNRFLEDYLAILPDLDGSFTQEKFRERIQPLVTIASNNGFEFLM